MLKINIKSIIPKLFYLLIVIILVCIIALISYKYYQTGQELKRLKTDPTAYSQIQEEGNKKIIEDVGKIIVLPKEENPTIATIIDAEKIKDSQPIFKNAQNGYILIVYSNQAFLYDPVNKKIVDTQQIFQNPLAFLSNFKFYIINGSKLKNLGTEFELELKKAVPSVTVVGNTNSKNTYEKSLLVDLNGDKEKEAAQISQALNIQVSKLPDNEMKPTVGDFLLILGSDKDFLLATPSAQPGISPSPTPKVPSPTN